MLNMADSCQKTQEMTLCIKEADAIDALEKLQEHENEVFLECEKYKIYSIKLNNLNYISI